MGKKMDTSTKDWLKDFIDRNGLEEALMALGLDPVEMFLALNEIGEIDLERFMQYDNEEPCDEEENL